jgi:hypothetical protein
MPWVLSDPTALRPERPRETAIRDGRIRDPLADPLLAHLPPEIYRERIASLVFSLQGGGVSRLAAAPREQTGPAFDGSQEVRRGCLQPVDVLISGRP